MQRGTFWYAVDGGGEPRGYARLEVTPAPGEGEDLSWELRLAFPNGSTYEETRTERREASGRLLAATLRTAGGVLEVERQGDRFLGRSVRPGTAPVGIDVEAAEDAAGGLAFLLAADVASGATPTREVTAYDDARGFRPAGRTVLELQDPETVPLDGEDVPARKVVVRRADGLAHPVWASDDGRILRADWGGGLTMRLSRAPTAGLYRPPPPVFGEAAESAPERLVLTGLFERVSPDEMFRWWTDRARLVHWWPPEAEIGAGVGGPYHLVWKDPPWRLAGEITAWEPPRAFGFTWTWDHAPEARERDVLVRFGPAEQGGTRVTVSHGPYAEDATEQAHRADHRRGWLAIGQRLAAEIAAHAGGAPHGGHHRDEPT